MHFQSLILETNIELNKEEISRILSNIYNLDIILDFYSLDSTEQKSIGIEKTKSYISTSFRKSENIKVGIIYEANKLTNEAQNAILKLLEEPPEDTILLLIGKNRNMLLSTVRSRCLFISKNELVSNTEISGIVKEFVNSTFGQRIKILDEYFSSKDKLDKLSTERVENFLIAFLDFLNIQALNNEQITSKPISNMIELVEQLYLATRQKVGTKLIMDCLSLNFTL